MTSSARALIIVVAVSCGLGVYLASRFLPDAPAAPAGPGARPTEARQVVASAPDPTPPTLAAAPAEQPADPPPRFDVVRVGARGFAVVAGRATPGAEVVLLEEEREIGRARADARGEWVILPAEALRPGTRQFRLLARIGGKEMAGPDVVVVVVQDAPPVVVAEAARQAAPAAAASRGLTAQPGPATDGPGPEAAPAPGQPLVVLVPSKEAAPRLLQGPAPASQQGLALGQVDYDEGGAIRFAGTAQPRSTVRVYVNDHHAGDAEADGQGRWALAPQESVSVGRHRLRVDQLATAGAVSARIEVPFQRDRVPEQGAAKTRIVVQPGNNLWRIARETYGRGTQFTVIYDANRNQIRDPDLIFPGQVFSLPGAPDEPEPAPQPATPAVSSRSR